MTTTFSERLKHAMNEAHMSQSELSSKTGISKASISQYLSGKNQPKEDKILLMADALKASPDFLLGKDVPPMLPRVSVDRIGTRKRRITGCDYNRPESGRRYQNQSFKAHNAFRIDWKRIRGHGAGA